MSDKPESDGESDEPKAIQIIGRNKGRANLIPYRKGVSGNPGGRPAKDPELMRLQAEISIESAEFALHTLRERKTKDIAAIQTLIIRHMDHDLGPAKAPDKRDDRDFGPIAAEVLMQLRQMASARQPPAPSVTENQVISSQDEPPKSE